MFSHHLQCHQPASVITCIAFATVVPSAFSNATCSSPRHHLQVPAPLHVKYFATVVSRFAHPHWPSLQTRTILNRIQVRQLIKLSSVLVGPPLRTTPWRSWTLPVIGHIYLFSYVSSSPFCLSSRALFQPILFSFFSLDFKLHRHLFNVAPTVA